MNFNKYTIAFSFLILGFISCQKENSIFTESKTAVVAAYLFADSPVDSIVISQSFSYNQTDSSIILLDNLEVILSDFENKFPLNSVGNGVYQNLDLTVDADKSYRLEFMWEGKQIAAETYIPQKKEVQISTETVQLEEIEAGIMGGGPPPGGGGNIADPIEITWDNSEGDYYYVVINNIEENPEYVNENIALFDDENGGRRQFTFISEPNTIDQHQIDPRRELTQFGTHEVIVFRVNPEYAALYESSGNTSQSLEQPFTNIENGLGIFTGVNSDTLYLEVEKI